MSNEIALGRRSYKFVASMILATVHLFSLHVASFSPSKVLAQDIDPILKIERGGGQIANASAAAEKLIKSGGTIEGLLANASQANPVAKNWLLSIAQAIADRQPIGVTQTSLERILADPKGDGEIRYWALDRLASGKKDIREQLLLSRTEDSSLDIRYEAIALALSKLPEKDAAKNDDTTKQKAIASYQRLIQSARLPEQINTIAAKLKELDVEVDLLKQFGFISEWRTLGPFDNRMGVGFPMAYPPEAEFLRDGKVDLKKSYQGKTGPVEWKVVTTNKPDGEVDLNSPYSNEKGAVVYAFTTVQSAADIACQVRLGCINANKVWVNAVEATANNVYHTGSQIDQYVGQVNLKRGTNNVMVKLCQNEQTESWAQNFAFQLRFTDATGKSIDLTK